MTEQQSRPLTGTDVRILAGGYWSRYFSWRAHPRAKWLLLVGGGAFALLLILLAVASSVDATPDAPSGYRILAILLAAVGIVTVLAGFGIYIMDKEHYINKCVDRWERGDLTLPDEASVAQHIKRNWREEDDVVPV